METRYRALSDDLKQRFGTKVYKLAIASGCTCPNRDGTLGTRGCSFCSEGSGHFTPDPSLSITEQLDRARAKIDPKYDGSHYIAYFQSYTNTYGPVDILEAKFREAASYPGIVQLAIATRPDCISEEMLQMLVRLNQDIPISVELGLQSIHENTAAEIRRGYPLAVFDDCMRRLKHAGIPVVVHMILGLPGETAGQMVETAAYIGASGASGIKLQLLHVLRGTDLGNEYQKHPFPVLEMDTYIEILLDCIEVLPENIVIHRLTGDGDREHLLAPVWSLNKKHVLNTIRHRMKERNCVQGRFFRGKEKTQ